MCRSHCREQGMRIRHGVLPTYTYRVGEKIRNALFWPAVPESLVLSGDSCSAFVRGRRREKWSLASGETQEEVFKLLYASHHNVYVGVCRNAVKVSSIHFICGGCVHLVVNI